MKIKISKIACFSGARRAFYGWSWVRKLEGDSK